MKNDLILRNGENRFFVAHLGEKLLGIEWRFDLLLQLEPPKQTSMQFDASSGHRRPHQ
jgi:hypothetical protein